MKPRGGATQAGRIHRSCDFGPGFTSERSAETASHPHGTANSQNICVTIRVLLTQKTERGKQGGNKRDERDNEG
ncbi:hypothetical protein F7725_017939 [Dissostichus mawsoni]|uniref:Uncharacterized protein n=1 Tax=Dissostichus mawsoni TaxID=36200 RepID=A0A7J5XQ75_DISMA|nr:hypothetical protein F7725_017939 [Dissostichus mawsoni]